MLLYRFDKILGFSEPIGISNSELGNIVMAGDGNITVISSTGYVSNYIKLPNSPRAFAGTTQWVEPNTLVTLDGSKSIDPDNGALTYQWKQVTGDPITLTGENTANPTFITPVTYVYNVPLTFELTVTDIENKSDTATVNIFSPSSPVVSAGLNQEVFEGEVVTLDGSSSYAAPGNSITGYSWGLDNYYMSPNLVITNSTSPIASFTAPEVEEDTVLIIKLSVTSSIATGGTRDSDFYKQVMVRNINPPIANAGIDQSILEATPVTLDGNASTDRDGEITAYNWLQTAGPAVTLINSATATPTFTAPLVDVDTPLSLH